jgi:peptide deformylase
MFAKPGKDACRVKGMRAKVERCAEIRLTYLDKNAEPHERVLEGWNAIVAQHECDHLDGVLYVDRCDTQTLSFDTEFQRFGTHEGEE